MVRSRIANIASRQTTPNIGIQQRIFIPERHVGFPGVSDLGERLPEGLNGGLAEPVSLRAPFDFEPARPLTTAARCSTMAKTPWPGSASGPFATAAAAPTATSSPGAVPSQPGLQVPSRISPSPIIGPRPWPGKWLQIKQVYLPLVLPVFPV